MDKFLKQILTFLQELTINQKVLLGGSIVFVGLAVWVFVRLIGGGDYKTLYTGLAPADAQSMYCRT